MDRYDDPSKTSRRKKKEKVFAFRWDIELIELWEKVATRISRKEQATTTARDLLEEYLCCFLTNEELDQRGLVAYKTYPPPRIALALEKSKKNRQGDREGNP